MNCSISKKTMKLLMFVSAYVACASFGCNGAGGRLTNGDSKELWPMENGFCVLLVVRNKHNKWRYIPAFSRMVFDINLLQRSHELRKQWLAVEEGEATQDEFIEWDKVSNEKIANDVADWWVSFSKALLQAEVESSSAPPELVEVVRSAGTNWSFSKLQKKNGCVVREHLCEADRRIIQNFFFVLDRGPHFPVWKIINRDDLDVVIGEGPRFRVLHIFDWEFYNSWAYTESCNDYEKADARFIVRWRGHEYKGAGITDGELLAIPGLGVVATGDFRPGVTLENRYVVAHTIFLSVPSQNIHVLEPKLSFEIIREIK